jgi:exopolysaccharide biosynthesis polyprenyl glycosylphosphotransferase
VATPVALARAEAGVAKIAKRVLDVIVAFVGLMLAALPMLCIALIIRLTSPGPILFRQARVGKGGRLFTSYKFRSMYMDAEDRLAEVRHLNQADGPIFKIRQDPRMTPVGRFLRRTSLDELPQLFNAFRGEMSIVGPRPALMTEVLAYEPWQLGRLTVRPGLTGLWQVSGRSDLPFEAMMRLDLEYIRRWSLWFDLWLLILTVPTVVSGRGAY